jgi:hypothetical protein
MRTTTPLDVSGLDLTGCILYAPEQTSGHRQLQRGPWVQLSRTNTVRHSNVTFHVEPFCDEWKEFPRM